MDLVAVNTGRKILFKDIVMENNAKIKVETKGNTRNSLGKF